MAKAWAQGADYSRDRLERGPGASKHLNQRPAFPPAPQDAEVWTRCHLRAADPRLPVPPNSSEPLGRVRPGTVAGEMFCSVAALQRGETLSVTVYPQLKKLPRSVAKQPRLIWEDDSRATGQADLESLIKWNLCSWRGAPLPHLGSERKHLISSCCVHSPKPERDALSRDEPAPHLPPPLKSSQSRQTRNRTMKHRRERTPCLQDMVTHPGTWTARNTG